MDKRKLIANTAEKTNYARWEVDKITDALLEGILEALQQGEEVYFKEFGRFKLKVRKARNAIHPQSKQPIQIPEKIHVAFTISKQFKANDGVLERIRKEM